MITKDQIIQALKKAGVKSYKMTNGEEGKKITLSRGQVSDIILEEINDQEDVNT